jgi:hypothetical protein
MKLQGCDLLLAYVELRVNQSQVTLRDVKAPPQNC